MLYLSRLLLNDRCSAVRRDLADCQELHRTVLSAFPDTGNQRGGRERFHVLHRLEPGSPDTGAARLLVQSCVPPDWSGLPHGYLLPANGANPACRRVDDVYARLRAGMTVAFRLRANPTKRIGGRPDGGEKSWSGKRVNLAGEAEQVAWLRRKGESGGFELISVGTSPEVSGSNGRAGQKVTGKRGEPDQGLVFGSALFEGELRITEADAFRQTLEHGIGSGKAYGFGLLSIAPARR